MSNTPSDEQLLRDVRAGRAPERALEALHARYRSLVENYFRRRRSSAKDAEDLAQEVFMNAFTALDKFQGRSSFRSWLFAIASNTRRNRARFFNQQKRKGDEVGIDLGGLRPLEEVVPDPGPDPGQELEAKETAEALETEISNLPERMRQCVHLRRQGYALREIAIILGVHDGTVKAQLHQATRRLGRSFSATPDN